MTAKSPSRLSQSAKFALEVGPLVVYFLITFKFHERLGFDWGEDAYRPAVIWLLISTPIQVGLLWWGERKIPWSPVIVAVFLIAFGSLSLLLDDDRWIKIKPTIVYLFFTAALATGALLRRPLLQFYVGNQLSATTKQWRRLTRNFIIFFVCLSILNEVFWRGIDWFMAYHFSGLVGSANDASFQAWSATKPFFMLISFVFTIWQLWPLLQGQISEAKSER